jgi:hypothetical protein
MKACKRYGRKIQPFLASSVDRGNRKHHNPAELGG